MTSYRPHLTQRDSFDLVYQSDWYYVHYITNDKINSYRSDDIQFSLFSVIDFEYTIYMYDLSVHRTLCIGLEYSTWILSLIESFDVCIIFYVKTTCSYCSYLVHSDSESFCTFLVFKTYKYFGSSIVKV